jgi:AAA domain
MTTRKPLPEQPDYARRLERPLRDLSAGDDAADRPSPMPGTNGTNGTNGSEPRCPSCHSLYAGLIGGGFACRDNGHVPLAAMVPAIRRWWRKQPRDAARGTAPRGAAILDSRLDPTNGESRIEKPHGFTLARVSDLLAEPEEATPWLVDGLLGSGGVSLTVARPKIGKTTLIRYLARCVARGEPFLGRATAQGTVLLFLL